MDRDNRGSSAAYNGDGRRGLNEEESYDDECKPLGEEPYEYITFSSFKYKGHLDTSGKYVRKSLQTAYELAYNELVGECSQSGAFREIVTADFLAHDEEKKKFLIATTVECNACREYRCSIAMFNGTATDDPPPKRKCDCPGPYAAALVDLYTEYLKADEHFFHSYGHDDYDHPNDDLYADDDDHYNTFAIVDVEQPCPKRSCTGEPKHTTFDDTTVCLSYDDAVDLGFIKATPSPTRPPYEKPTRKPKPTPKPTPKPANPPTPKPTRAPKPTPKPTPKPASAPTDMPTNMPTNIPTNMPTNMPTEAPTP